MPNDFVGDSDVGDSDPFCVGKAEGFSDGTPDGLALEGISVFADGRNEGTEDIPLGEKVIVGIDDIEGNVVGFSDSLSVGEAEGFSDGTPDGLRLGCNEGIGVISLGENDGAKFASWEGLNVTLAEGAGVSSTLDNKAPITRPRPVIQKIIAKIKSPFLYFVFDG